MPQIAPAAESRASLSNCKPYLTIDVNTYPCHNSTDCISSEIPYMISHMIGTVLQTFIGFRNKNDRKMKYHYKVRSDIYESLLLPSE